MGGSSKPADPKVTPYQEPAAPTNPIPNFFGGQTGGGYKPNTGASQQAFTMPTQAPAQPQQAAPAMDMPSTPWQAPQQPQSQPMQGMTGGMGQQGDTWGNAANANMGGMANMGGTNRPMMPFGIPTRQNFGQGFGGGFDTNALMQRFQSNPNFLMDMFSGGNAPRYRNYTDTNAAQSTDAFGRPIEQPSTRMFSNIPGTDWRG
jgi:hypothetical protein